MLWAVGKCGLNMSVGVPGALPDIEGLCEPRGSMGLGWAGMPPCRIWDSVGVVGDWAAEPDLGVGDGNA